MGPEPEIQHVLGIDGSRTRKSTKMQHVFRIQGLKPEKMTSALLHAILRKESLTLGWQDFILNSHHKTY